MNYAISFLYKLENTKYNTVKKPAKNPPNTNDFNLPTFSFSKGKIGRSIICINGY
jgi:hypothetical protein